MTRPGWAIAGTAAIAALSTLGDFVWVQWIPAHRVPYGLAHGTLLFAAIGLFLGAVASRPGAGAAGGALIGAAGAGSFYLLAPLAGYAAMFPAWVAVWIALGALYRGLAAREIRPALVRGPLAALASGAAFYLVSGIWMPFDPAGWDYLVHFGSWMVAYLPGFALLLVESVGFGETHDER